MSNAATEMSAPLATRRPSCLELALAFAYITIFAFGGGAPWVKRMAVDDRRWLTLDEFAEVTALSQSIPGAIFFNLATVIGVREQGVKGAAAALIGILVPAIAVACLCERLEARLDANIQIHHALRGVVAVAAGLFASTWLQLTQATWRQFGVIGLAIAAAAALGVVAFGLSLPLVILTVLPFAIYAAWRIPR